MVSTVWVLRDMPMKKIDKNACLHRVLCSDGINNLKISQYGIVEKELLVNKGMLNMKYGKPHRLSKFCLDRRTAT